MNININNIKDLNETLRKNGNNRGVLLKVGVAFPCLDWFWGGGRRYRYRTTTVIPVI